MPRFDDIMLTIFKWEGGFVDDPQDPGGATNMGITHRALAQFRGVASVTPQEVKDLTKDEAIAIFRANYWRLVHGDDLPPPLDFVVMDGAVNQGPAGVARLLQALVGASQDGDIGEKTLKAVGVYIERDGVDKLAVELAEARKTRYEAHPKIVRFRNGWRNRLNDVMKTALTGRSLSWTWDGGPGAASASLLDEAEAGEPPVTLLRAVIEDTDLQAYLAFKGVYNDAIDGIFGRNSRDAMNAVLNRHRDHLSGVLSQWDNERRKMALGQLLCAEADLDVGRVDGLFGPQTEAAFLEFNRRKHNLPPETWVDDLIDNPFPPFTPVETTAQTFPRERDIQSFYGPPCKAKLVRLQLPYVMRIAWDLRQSVSSFMINEKCHDSAARAFQKVAETYSMDEIKSIGLDIFSGCYNCRKKRGGSSWSTHSWAIAIDFDNTRNQLSWNHTRARLAKPDAVPFWQIWEAEGWVSLGRSRDFDWMHVQAARLNS